VVPDAIKDCSPYPSRAGTPQPEDDPGDEDTLILLIEKFK
jgi:hypothetical protein